MINVIAIGWLNLLKITKYFLVLLTWYGMNICLYRLNKLVKAQNASDIKLALIETVPGHYAGIHILGIQTHVW